MATGDIKNNLGKLQSELRAVNFHEADYEQLSRGVPQAYLPIYHHVLMNFSKSLAEKISEIGVDLFGKSDMRFIEAMYKVLRELFAYKPPLTKEQFFNAGYSEKKVIMCSEIVGMIKAFHKDSNPRKPKSAKSTKTNISSAVATAGAVGITMSHSSKFSTKQPSASFSRVQRNGKDSKQQLESKASGDHMPSRTVPVFSKETISNSSQESADHSSDVGNLSAIPPSSPTKDFRHASTDSVHTPINIVASTPCPPAKDIRAPTLEKYEYIGQLNHIVKQMQEIQNKIVCIEDRMSVMEDRLCNAEQSAPAGVVSALKESDDLFDPLKLQNLLAKMTVLEHKVAMLDAKPDVIKNAAVSIPENGQQILTSSVSQESEITGTTNLTKPHESLEHYTHPNDSENITYENESKKSGKKTSSPIQTAAFKSLHLHEEFESSPSPIPMKRLASRVFEQGTLYNTKESSSFGELNLGKIEIDSFGLECSQENTSKVINQRQRIAAMLNETEKMLNINGNAEMPGGQA